MWAHKQACQLLQGSAGHCCHGLPLGPLHISLLLLTSSHWLHTAPSPSLASPTISYRIPQSLSRKTAPHPSTPPTSGASPMTRTFQVLSMAVWQHWGHDALYIVPPQSSPGSAQRVARHRVLSTVVMGPLSLGDQGSGRSDLGNEFLLIGSLKPGSPCAWENLC